MASTERWDHANRWLRLASLAVVFAVTGCPVRPGVPVIPTPSFRLGALTSAADSAGAVLGYVAPLEFDTLPGAGDDQLLHLGTCPGPDCRHGPRAQIQPLRGTHALTRAQLAAGRVIARLVNRDSVDYPKFGLRARSIVYWWVDSTSRGWRSVFISNLPGARPFVSDLIIRQHSGYYWGQAIAKWLWNPRDEGSWSSCERSGCCESGGLQE